MANSVAKRIIRAFENSRVASGRRKIPKKKTTFQDEQQSDPDTEAEEEGKRSCGSLEA